MFRKRKALDIMCDSTVYFAEESLITNHYREIFLLL